jgi:hemoglobin/transferrin/lactoferrin receptor protein
LRSDVTQIDDVVLSISKSRVKKNRIAEKIEIITEKDIRKMAPQTSADLLANTPGVRVQKSQGGGGSPVLRGFEANRVLLVVDNVRMNNAIYRSGHLQNSITISPSALARTEVLFGPSSVVYGSDALGGVVHFYTKTPKIGDSISVSGDAFTRYSSANNERTYNLNTAISFNKWASFTSVNYSDFGDLRMGRSRNHGFKNWGKVFTYSDNDDTTFNETPVNNGNPNRQKNTGYRQIDLLQKFNIQTSNRSNLGLNFQYSASSDIPRFDRLSELKDGILKFAEWRYGPQKRFLFSPRYEFRSDSKIMKSGAITAAYQNIEESRIKRKYGDTIRGYQEEQLDVYTLNGDFSVPLSKKRDLSYGLEFTHNDVSSKGFGRALETNGSIITGFGTTSIAQSRYPDGGSTYTTAAGYVNYRQDINRKSTLNTGARYTYTKLKALFVDQTFVTLPDPDITLSNSSITANLSYAFRPEEFWQINGVISSGFRSPNIDDVGKLREKNGLLTVPNVGLRPEYAYNAELGISKFISNKKHQVSFNTYYTLLNNYIARDAFEVLNDSSTPDPATVLYEGEEVTTVANVNRGTAYIVGGTFDFGTQLSQNWLWRGNLTYTKGKSYDDDRYLPSISPFFGSSTLTFQKNKFEAALGYRFSFKKSADEYSIGGEDNLEQSPQIDPNPTLAGDEFYNGHPAWNVFDLRTNYQVSERLALQVSLDNIFDIHYKEFASAISAPGRNFRLTVAFNF